MKKLVVSIFCSAIFLYGCKDDNSLNAYRYEVLKALDSGNYDKVIQLLQKDNYKKAFSNEELNINLAAAYIGKAGYDVSSILNDILDTDVDADGFKVFSQAISKKASGKSLMYLSKAIEKYSEILQNVSCEDKQSLTELQKDACFLKGLVETAKGTNSFVLAIEDNPQERAGTLEKWIEGVNPCSQDDINANNVPDDLEATACAIEYANNGSCYIDNGSFSTSSIAFSKEENTYNYTLLKIDINSDITCSQTDTNTFYRLISGTDVVITDGYCDLDLQPCSEPDGIDCFPCPIIDNQQNITVEDTIVETINNGVDTIISIIPEDQRSDIEENLREFKEEICIPSPSHCLCDNVPCNSEFDIKNAQKLEITEEALAQYLKK